MLGAWEPAILRPCVALVREQGVGHGKTGRRPVPQRKRSRTWTGSWLVSISSVGYPREGTRTAAHTVAVVYLWHRRGR